MPTHTQAPLHPAILVGVAPAASVSLIEDLAGTVSANARGCVTLQATAPVEAELIVVWPIGTTAGVNEVVLVDGSFELGEAVDPARGWLTTLDQLAAGAILAGRDGACGQNETAPVVVITQVVGGPTQE